MPELKRTGVRLFNSNLMKKPLRIRMQDNCTVLNAEKVFEIVSDFVD